MIRTALLAALVLAALPAHHADAQTEKYKKFGFKAALGAGATGINNKGVITAGYFAAITDVRNCFTLDTKKGTKTAVMEPNGAGGTECWGINDSGTLVGDYIDSTGTYHGFVDVAGTFTTIDPPGTTKTVVYGIANTGEMGGYFIDASGVQHGFIYDGTTYTTVDNPAITSSENVFGVNSSGAYTLYGLNKKNAGVSFLYSGTTITPIAYPKATSTYAHQLSDSGLTALAWIDSSNVEHGGVYDTVAKAYYDLDYPSAGTTLSDGVNNEMTAVGRFELTAGGTDKAYEAKGKLAPVK
jgi:hypothetical protein